ncbi:putative late blight resistance protein homolog R1B-12 isoform X3 [Solanum stenotomum]|uniref:putative late blight resistance protein homolog R1B-12 isoform X3 n=1 Tax=Solanum stenotomum TaxID=172797 RepID=UPI0020D06FA0|nr:putative late blight resistance protein homolog R1B-12 isoform X3 [Solanum stenotomum]
MKHLERMIQEAANGVEDTIDSHVYDSYVLVQSNRVRRKAYTIFHQNLEYAIEEIGLIQKEVMKKIKVNKFNSKISHSRDTSSQIPLDQKDVIIGLDEDLLRIKDRLIVQSSKLEVVPIIGMGGIGKTTLARRVYDDSLIAYHFYVRAWTNVSQEFDTREIFLGILRSIGVVKDEVERNSTNEQLAERVYRSLKGRKYLIVLDDMWSIEAWQHVRRSFPDDHNGSRIVLTTRLVDVASCACSGNSLHQMRFLSVEESWTLLRDKVFGNGSYSPELEKIGRCIVHQCQGLPLAVVAIGGLLSKISKETSSWENVAEKVGSLMTSDTMDCLNILSLSYNHLPQYLKTCFLYMGVFAETREIPVWKLIKLWISEGFVKKVNHKNLEDVAEENLRELVDRSLVLVGKHTSLGKIKTCKMHDLVQDMCLREAQYENFIHFKTRTNLQWEDMNILRKLPNLEVLKLKDHSFRGLIWKLSNEDEDGFLKLKFLLLERMSLKQWEATSYHFPSLEHLVLTDCRYLEQIPFDFAEIQSLQLIELHECKRSVLVSAEQIQEEQQSFGNDDLIIRVNSIYT